MMGNTLPYPGVSVAKQPMYRYVPGDDDTEGHAQSTETLLFQFCHESHHDFERGVQVLLAHFDQAEFDALRQVAPSATIHREAASFKPLVIEAHCMDVYARRRILARHHPTCEIAYKRSAFDAVLATHCCGSSPSDSRQGQASGSSTAANSTDNGRITVMPRADTCNRYYVLPLYRLPLMAPALVRTEVERQSAADNNELCDLVFGIMPQGHFFNGTATLVFRQPRPPLALNLFGKRYGPRVFDNRVYDHYCLVCKQLNSHDTHDCPLAFNELDAYGDEDDGDPYMTETSADDW